MKHYLLDHDAQTVACGAEKRGHSMLWTPVLREVTCKHCLAMMAVTREQRL